MRNLLLSIVAMLSLVISTACGQSNKSKLTAEILHNATSIQYYTSNGTVAPDYHYGVTIVVSKDSVCLTVTKGYQNKIVYQQTAPLTSDQYQQFIQQLAAHSIRNTKPDASPSSGGPVESIEVTDNSDVLFQGSTGAALTFEGDLGMTFHDLLPNEMAQVFRHPYDL